jgi:hypothetical protein
VRYSKARAGQAKQSHTFMARAHTTHAWRNCRHAALDWVGRAANGQHDQLQCENGTSSS